jgi:DNA-binding MarR family transcriptional regulator
MDPFQRLGNASIARTILMLTVRVATRNFMIDPSVFETTQCLCLASRRAARAITRQFDRAMRAHGIRATQFTLLSALELKGSQPIGELAELIGVERTTLTRNLAVAEESSLVDIRPGDDARARIVSITSTGRHALRRALPTWRRVQGELTGAIGKGAADGLRQLSGGPSLAFTQATIPNIAKERRT